MTSKSILSIIATHGEPYYLKSDVELYDALLLKSIFAAGIRPPFISAESHSIEVFSALVSDGHYNAFKLVDGPTVSRVYSDRAVRDEITGQSVQYSFPHDSAGPFGNEVDGEWLSADRFFKLLAFEGLGWKDIHATSQHPPAHVDEPSLHQYYWRHNWRIVKRKFRKL